DHQPIAAPLQPLLEGTVQVRAQRTLFEPDRGGPGSLVGRITQVGPAVTTLAVGDTVVALGQPVAQPVLAAADCLKLAGADLDLDQAALWPLIACLTAALRQGHLEL